MNRSGIVPALLSSSVLLFAGAGAPADTITYEFVSPPLTLAVDELDDYLRSYGIPPPRDYELETVEDYIDLLADRDGRDLQTRVLREVAFAVGNPVRRPIGIVIDVDEERLPSGTIRNQSFDFFDGTAPSGFDIRVSGIGFADYSTEIEFDEKGQVPFYDFDFTLDFGGYFVGSEFGAIDAEEPLFEFQFGSPIIYRGPLGEFVRTGLPAPIPLPGSAWLLMAGLAGMFMMRRGWREPEDLHGSQ